MRTEATEYFYTMANGRRGPVGFDELRTLAVTGDLTRRHKVWCEGMATWQEAGKLEGLFEDLPPDIMTDSQCDSPPPLPPLENSVSAATPRTSKPSGMIQCRQCGQPVSAEARTCVKCGVPSPASGEYIDVHPGGFWVGKILAVGIAMFFIWMIIHFWGRMGDGGRSSFFRMLLLSGGAGIAFLFWNGRGKNPLNEKQEVAGETNSAATDRKPCVVEGTYSEHRLAGAEACATPSSGGPTTSIWVIGGAVALVVLGWVFYSVGAGTQRETPSAPLSLPPIEVTPAP